MILSAGKYYKTSNGTCVFLYAQENIKMGNVYFAGYLGYIGDTIHAWNLFGNYRGPDITYGLDIHEEIGQREYMHSSNYMNGESSCQKTLMKSLE